MKVNKIQKLTVILFLIGVSLFITPFASYAHTTIDIDFYELFEHHSSIMLIIDSKTGAIEHANKAAAEFYGYATGQMETMNIRSINTSASEEIEKDWVRSSRAVAGEKHTLADSLQAFRWHRASPG